jgi:molybdopterin/thiamine biosynthesis adenylyltransferase
LGSTLKNIPINLRIARRRLDEIPSIRILRDWVWYEKPSSWVLECELTLSEYNENPYIHRLTNWHIKVDPQYPLGHISFFPSKIGGITHTFQHQLNNSNPNDDLPWLPGSICLDLNVSFLGRFFSESEPFSTEDRLYWYFQRALSWLRAASQGTFAQPGELFELPDFSPVNEFTVAFSENSASFKFWMSSSNRAGIVTLARIKNTTIFPVTHFINPLGKLLLSPAWGNVVDGLENSSSKGLWLKLDAIPTIKPWQPPNNFGELVKLVEAQGLSFFDLIKRPLSQLRDGRRHFLLIGFPIPSRHGGDLIRMHWQALRLPVLSFGTKTMSGFRPDTNGYVRRDKAKILTEKTLIDWIQSENWHAEQISARGSLPNSIAGKKILIIGCGAIGAVVAELLVRGNATGLTLIDYENLEVGNLVRHTLEIADIKKPKAEQLANRLHSINPNASVDFLARSFPPNSQSAIAVCQKCDFIIDCSGSDEVLFALSEFPWDSEKTIFSMSVNYGATKSFLFIYRGLKFPIRLFSEKIKPYLLDSTSIDEIPVDGIGCWHPVFPGRSDDIWLLISATFKELINSIDKTEDSDTHSFIAYEQIVENGQFAGLRKIT